MINQEKENELMIITAEECSEVAQECMKILRFGWKPEEKEKLTEEVGDVQAMINLLIEHGYLDKDEIDNRIKTKHNKLKKYSKLFD